MRRSSVPQRWAAVAAVALASLGCETGRDVATGPSRSFPGTTLTVAAVGDPAALAAVRAWKTTWERDTGATVAFAPGPVDPADLKGADVVVFPGDRLGDLVDAKSLAVLPDGAIRPPPPLGQEAAPPDPLGFSDVIPAFREQVSEYGDDRMALPLGGSGLVLVYRRDAFESEANKLAAKEEGIALAPPKTWEDLDALVAFFHGRTGRGLAVALGDDPEGVGDAILIARAAASGLHPDHYALLFHPDTLEPRIASPPFVEALGAIAKWKDFAPPRGETFDAEAARAAFRAGEAVFLIDRAERASRWTDPKKPASVLAAPLPGSKRVYEPDRRAWQDLPAPNRAAYLPRGGGLLVAITPAGFGAKKEAALDFVRSLAGPDTARLLLTEPSYPVLPVRNAQLGSGLPDPRSALGVDARGWGEAVARTVTAPRVIPGLRIPRADAYLAALTKARLAAMAGTPPESALRDAAGAWAALSRSLGVPRQLWHYRRSLNTLITDPEPPPRGGP